jgi:hypothetical protein
MTMPPLTSGVDDIAAIGRVIDPTDLTLSQRIGERCVFNNCRRRLWDEKVLHGSLPDNSPVFACPDHEAVAQ